MSSIDIERTVGELVTERPSNSRIFEEFGIDYCCGGKIPLSEACAEKGVSTDEVLRKLEEDNEARSQEDATNYGEMPLDELVDHIIATHHAYIVREVPRLLEMANRVQCIEITSCIINIRLAIITSCWAATIF